ncbi:MAG: hypothetical protein HUJ69_00790 [Lachnospiraceae bacterium]|nr:hypothetical protein [Lachnospiraceae bacterium]
MNIDFNILSDEEKLVLMLRTLFHRKGYAQYRMSKFEDYDLYSKNKDFLVLLNLKKNDIIILQAQLNI